MANDREYWRQRTRNEAKIAGVDPDIAEKYVESESGFTVMGQHPGSHAMGLGGLMPGTAKDLGVNPMDPSQNLVGTLRYLKQNYDKFGNWGQAVEAMKLGPGNVGNADFRASHPAEWSSAQRIAGGSLGGVLYPGSGQYDPTMRNVRNRVEGAQNRWDAAAAAFEQVPSLSLPRSPVLGQRDLAAGVIPGLFANIATAISGNPLYQQAQMGREQADQEERQQGLAENRQLSRQEVMQNRQEVLQGIANRMDYASKRLDAAEHYEEAMDLQMQHAKVLKEIEQMRATSEQERARIMAGGQLASALAKRNLSIGYDANGNMTIEGQGNGVKLKRNERQSLIQGYEKMRLDNKTNKNQDPRFDSVLQGQIFREIATPDEDDATAPAFVSRAGHELQGYAQFGNDPSVLNAYIMTALASNPNLPGAVEMLKTFEDNMKEPAPEPAGGGAPGMGGETPRTSTYAPKGQQQGPPPKTAADYPGRLVPVSTKGVFQMGLDDVNKKIADLEKLLPTVQESYNRDIIMKALTGLHKEKVQAEAQIQKMIEDESGD